MKMPPDTLIARRKIIDYLLVPRPEDDKSAFLAKAGYMVETADQLLADLRGAIVAVGSKIVGERRIWSKIYDSRQIDGTQCTDLARCFHLDD